MDKVAAVKNYKEYSSFSKFATFCHATFSISTPEFKKMDKVAGGILA